MKISFAPYKMQLKPGWSRNHSGEGALIKIEDSEAHCGYADLHPWVSLGDQKIEEQVQLIKNGLPSRLAQRSLQLALSDLKSRKQKSKLCIEEVQNILSEPSCSIGIENIFAPIGCHYLEMSLIAIKNKMLSKISNKPPTLPGCLALPGRLIKVKVSDKVQQETEILNEIFQIDSKNIWRLDFNESASLESFVDFWNALPDQLQKQIQFCEDPVPWDFKHWQYLNDIGVPLAADRVLDRQLALALYSESPPSLEVIKQIINVSSYVVLKPALRDYCELLEKVWAYDFFKTTDVKKIVITSYLDHPVGIMHAYLESLKIAKMAPKDLTYGGLASMSAYETTEFDISKNLNELKTAPSNFFGIGFERELERQNWIYCSQL